jgi:hypothetical protein
MAKKKVTKTPIPANIPQSERNDWLAAHSFGRAGASKAKKKTKK